MILKFLRETIKFLLKEIILVDLKPIYIMRKKEKV